jgi:carboxymethylenebutenolidase
MKAAGKTFEPVTYEGAGHGFMRAGEDPANTVPGNKTAREQGYARLVKLLKGLKSSSTIMPAKRRGELARKAAEPVVACHEAS